MGKRLVRALIGSAIIFSLAVLAAIMLSRIDRRPCCSTASHFQILSGSENQSLEPIIQEFAKREKVVIQMTYDGSVDIMQELGTGSSSRYDAVWPANTLWITLGDTSGVVKSAASIMRSPVVFAVKRSVAERLGWVDRDVRVDEILTAADAGQLRFMMTSATQSDSGAAAYLGFLYAFAGHPEVLTAADLHEPALRDKITRILGAQSRSAGSSGWLKDEFLNHYDEYDAMVNYEATVIEANQALVNSGREPLYVVYPVDGTAIADSPLALIDKNDAKKAELFQKLQQHLLSDEVQHQLLAQGRRTGLGVNPDPKEIDPRVFNPEWGIDPQRILTPIKTPEAAVVLEALNLYQTAFRKPSFTVYALDFSGSMKSNGGREQLLAAMRLLLDQESAARHFLQASPNDVTVVIPFNDRIIDVWIVKGNDPAQLRDLIDRIEQTDAVGFTDIYSPVIRGLEVMKEQGTSGSLPAVVLMTDGESNRGKHFADLKTAITATGMDGVPIFAITFGNVSPAQVNEITAFASGAVFDGAADLVGAFRDVKGYN